MIKAFSTVIKSGQQLNGLLITVPSPEVVEIVSASGFDWLFFDLEHSAIDIGNLQNLLRSVSDECFAAVRVPDAQSDLVAKVLEAGAEGVIFPRISTEEQARAAVSLCKYPPMGNRGVGLGRAQGYGNTFSEYLRVANERVACIIQIEDQQGAGNASRIASLNGVDALFVGPYDLSMSMGIPGNVTHDSIRSIIRNISEFKSEDTGLGIFSTDLASVKDYSAMGYNLIACGVDAQVVHNAARGILSAFQNAEDE